MYKPKFEVDLHCHTNRSDGNDTPVQLIDRASEFGLKVIAIADHDVEPPKTIEIDGNEIDILDYAKSKGVQLCLGSEISCDTNVEDVHILAFGCDWEHQKMKSLVAQVAQSKIDSYKELVGALQSEGMNINWEELLNNGGNPIEEDQIQKKMIFNLLAEKGHFPTWKDAKLATQKNPKFKIPRKKPDPVETIHLIHELGGIAILAHPFLINPDFEALTKYIQPLVEAGLDGIEATYPYSKTNYKGSLDDESLKKMIIEKYKSAGLMISGGSDYHGEWRKGATGARELGEAGITIDEFESSKLSK